MMIFATLDGRPAGTGALARPFALALALLGLAGCGADEAAVDATPERPAVVVPVIVRSFAEVIEASGQLLAKQQADVAAQVAGEISLVLADEGHEVKEGQIIIEIDPERRNLELDAARARLGEAVASVADTEREVRRFSALSGKKIVSDTQLDQAQTALTMATARESAARAELGQAERALRDASVRARFDGVIARRYVDSGEFVAAGQKLFEIVSLDPIEVEFHLPEADASRIREGQPISVRVAPYPDETFEAVVYMVSPRIDERTRTLRAKALIENADERLRPGFFARAALGVAERTDVITVPEEAVLQRADGAVVFRVATDDTVARVTVETGTIRDGWVEIRAGLSAGEFVVARGHADLIDGSRVVRRNPDGTLASATASAGALGAAAPTSDEEDAR